MRALLITTAREDHMIDSHPSDGKLQHLPSIMSRLAEIPRECIIALVYVTSSVVAEGRRLF